MTHFSTEETTQDAALRDVMQSVLPAESAPSELRERIAQMARIVDSQREFADSQRETAAKKRALRFRLGFSSAILASLVAIFALVWPQVMSNQALAQMDAAMARVSSVHMTRFRIDGAKKIKESESWYQNGAFRDERISDGFASLTKGGKRWFYRAGSGVVTVGPEPIPAKGRRRSSSVFTLSDIISDFESRHEKISLTQQGQTTLNGREVKRVLLEIKSDYETDHITLLVDALTDLPLRADLTSRTRYGKVGRWLMEMSYNRPLSAKLFEPHFAPGTRIVQAARQEADLKTRLARGLSKKRVGERVVAIRELQVNRNGDVFLFYTAGKRLGKTTGDGFRGNNGQWGRDWNVYLTDSLGTRYHPTREALSVSLFRPISVQGQRLDGDWWVPDVALQPGQRWKPRTFFVRFELSPKNLHGTFKQSFQISYSARARFSIPVDEAEPSVVPSLAQTIEMGLTEDSIIKRASEERDELPPGALPSPELVRELPEIGAFTPDSMHIATGMVGGVRVVNAESGAQTSVLRVPAAFSKLKVGAPLISADGQVLCAAIDLSKAFDSDSYSDAQWFTWNLASGQLLGSWRHNKVRDVSLRNIALSPDGTTLRIANSIITRRGTDGKQFWVETQNVSAEERDILTGRVRFQRVLKHEGFVISVEQSAMNSTDWTIVTSQNDKAERTLVRAWDVRSGALKQTFQNRYAFGTSRLKMANRAPLLAVGVEYFEMKNGVHDFGESEIRLFDVATGQLRRAIPIGGTFKTGVVALSNDGTRLAALGEDHKISVWNTQTGRLEQSLTGHGTGVYRMEFSPDGKWLQSVDAKEKALLWHLD